MQKWLLFISLTFLLLTETNSFGHWCSNIFFAYARIVVKPEKETIHLSNTPTPLRVYLKNNFPYKIKAYMRGNLNGYVYPTPQSQDIYPGQQVSFLFSLTGSGSPDVSQLQLQMKFRDSSSTNPSDWTWRNDTNFVLDQTPSQQDLIDILHPDYADQEQRNAGGLNAATLFDYFPNATLGNIISYFNRTGMEQLIHWFGYRFCYNYQEGWRCGNDDCPSTCAEGASWNDTTYNFGQKCMRSGIEIAVRKNHLGSLLPPARDAAINAFKDGNGTTQGGGSNQHKCLAAIVGAYLFKNATYTEFLNTMQNSRYAVPAACQDAARRVLNNTIQTNCSSPNNSSTCCQTGTHYEKAVCAAAEGLVNNDLPVKSVLMPNAGDGIVGVPGYDGMYYSYMLYLVQAYRRETTNYVPFYPDAGGPTPDSNLLQPDTVRLPDLKSWPDLIPTVDLNQPWPDTVRPPDLKPWPDLIPTVDLNQPWPDTVPPLDLQPRPDLIPTVDLNQPWPEMRVVTDQSVLQDTSYLFDGSSASDVKSQGTNDFQLQDSLVGGCSFAGNQKPSRILFFTLP